MAKRRRKRSRKKSFEISVGLYAVIFIIAAILGLGKLGPVGRGVAAVSMFLTGDLYIVFLFVLLILESYVFLKGDWPEFFSTRMLGLYLFVIGLLTLMHWEFISLNDASINTIFEETVNQLKLGFQSMMDTGAIAESINVGGGIIGGIFAISFAKLFSYLGMQIVTIVFMVVGLCMFTGFSIVEFTRNRLDDLEEAKNNRVKERDNEDKLTSKKVKISNGNEIDETDKQVVKNIDELKKMSVQTNKEDKEVISSNSVVNPSYQLPTLDILNKPSQKNNTTDNAAIEANISKLENVLKSFGVEAKVVEVHVGPTVAQYELEIASGTRVNKITTLSREIALALSKKDVRIEAPIPGKSTVGVEFANDKPLSVSFYEILASRTMQQAKDKKLMVPLGKSIMGEIGVCEINKMPHLLIAGTTGAGKSVCVNGIICSILMRAKPDEVKLAMIDPKMVELSCYNKIPHLVRDVVTDPKEAAVLLQKMVAEMEKRYRTFASTRTKNIESYNDYVEKYNRKHSDEPLDKMPYIVIIIDELSDLMMVAAKEVEDSILRITQKARAAGMHLIVATQRPSTEVITGLIKANIPSRISFAVSNGIDSRTILDQTGAEKLLGKGDMLYLPIGTNTPTRIQGSFITDAEIQRIIDFTKNQQAASYDDSLLKLDSIKDEHSSDNENSGGSSGDALYDEVVDFVVKSGKASASLLQRKFKIGYNRAATMIDLLEENGIIGPATGNSKPREVLVQYSENDDESE